jgi:hypothetical protein
MIGNLRTILIESLWALFEIGQDAGHTLVRLWDDGMTEIRGLKELFGLYFKIVFGHE